MSHALFFMKNNHDLKNRTKRPYSCGSSFFFFFLLLNKKNRVFGVDSSIPRHVTVMSNTKYITRVLLELLLEPLLSMCRTRTLTIKQHRMWYLCGSIVFKKIISILIKTQKVVTGDLTYQTMNQIEKNRFSSV